MPAGLFRHRGFIFLALVSALALPACGGGGGGGAGPDGAGQGLVLVNFSQANQDNVPINRVLTFEFSEPVDPSTVGQGTLQIRQGESFGLTATGEFVIDGAKVYFEPQLPTECDYSDAGIRPSTTYRVTVMGYPEEFCIRNSQGQPLDATITYEFGTRLDSDPEVLEDQIPATPPAIAIRENGALDVTPGDSEAAVSVVSDNEVVIGFTENLDPCTVNTETVFFKVYEAGDPGVNNAVPAEGLNEGNLTGFTPWDDQDPDDPYTWGSSTGGALPEPQLIPAQVTLTQDLESTQLSIRPDFGVFPENALCVVDLTFGIRDFGGSPFAPVSLSFTTQNLPAQDGVMNVEFDSSVEPWPSVDRTIDVDTVRSPGLAQGWLLFAGDGDNGGNTDVTPSWPRTVPALDCENKRLNDGVKDNFAPDVNVTLNTGSSRLPSTCMNQTDGSQAVVWEFATFRIKSGVVVTIAGENPAIILVQGQVVIESGGILRARGAAGQNGPGWSQSGTTASGGAGNVGGSDGGDGSNNKNVYGKDGWAGYGSPDYGTPAEEGGVGAGEGNFSAVNTSFAGNSGNGGGGGGGGHGTEGADGLSVVWSGSTVNGPPRGAGGEIYPEAGSPAKLYTPSAGSGGGGAGWQGYSSYSGSYYYDCVGGAGGGGGGFVDLTSQNDIRIYGTIDVSGGRGGTGGVGGYWATGGGGGGSGGAIRLLTPGDIDVTNGSLNAAGGVGGPGSASNYQPTENNKNNGGAGGMGYIALEDGDSVIQGISSSAMTPAYGSDQCYVGEFDSTRFQGGGLEGEALSGYILVGPLTAVSFALPEASDFLCQIPADAAITPDGTSILIEAAGYPLNADGTPDETVGDHFYTIGYFSYSGSPSEPRWNEGSNPPDMVVVNDGTGISNLDGSGFLRFRLRYVLPSGIGATVPGPWIDYMNLRFTYDQ